MRRLTGLDASFLYLETPNSHMHVAGTYVFDPAGVPGGYSFDRMKAVIGNRLHLLPPFRRRLVEVPFGLHHPIWIEDPDFDLGHHVLRAEIRAPGGKDELAEIAAEIMGLPLDRTRPLWEMHFIEGLEHGYVAMVSKTHHAAIDGASGAALTSSLLDTSPELVMYDEPVWLPEKIPSDSEMLVYAVNAISHQPSALARALRDSVEIALDHRKRPTTERTDPPAGLFRSPRTSLNVPISPRRGFGFTEVALADVKRVRKAFGGTVNDVVLAVCGSALRQYLVDRSELPLDPLVAMVPISIRSDDQQGDMGNRVSNMFVALATDVADPVARLQKISEHTALAKAHATAAGGDALASWAEFAAPGLVAPAVRWYASLRLAERHRPAFNVTISNVPGPQDPLYFAGSRLVAWYPMGPIFDGAALNMTVMSYNGVVYVGLVACNDAVPEMAAIAGYIDDAMAELLAAVERAEIVSPTIARRADSVAASLKRSANSKSVNNRSVNNRSVDNRSVKVKSTRRAESLSATSNGNQQPVRKSRNEKPVARQRK